MSAENDIEVARQLGALTATVEAEARLRAENHRHLLDYVADVERRLTDKHQQTAETLAQHVEREDARLKRIEEKLSLSRFIWLTIKALLATVALIIAFKTGDVREVWKHWRDMI